QGINPRTGEKVKIAASYAPTFKAGKALKTEVNKKKRATKKA
ncbi:MAG: HU family DNA-binding protein, partial [Clostridia bacterium]|nr:HU family DNA-binding protein [Clostridia bacterium]